MKGTKTMIIKTSQNRELSPVQKVKTEIVSQKRSSNNTTTNSKEVKSPYQIHIKTTYERGFSDKKRANTEFFKSIRIHDQYIFRMQM